MKNAFRIGFSFGLTSGIITTLGLIVGLNAGTHSQLAVIGGILTIAIADAFSDALGIHVAEESENQHSSRELWLATLATLLSKFIVALTFVVPFIYLELLQAVVVSIIWGLSLLAIFSFYLAKKQKINPRQVIIEHVFIAMIVVIITNYLGAWIRLTFNG